MSDSFYNTLNLIAFVSTIVLMIIISLRYMYLKKHSDKPFLDLLTFVIAGLLFAGIGIIGIINGIKNNFQGDNVIFCIILQLPFLISTVVYNILNVKYKKRITVIAKDDEFNEWK